MYSPASHRPRGAGIGRYGSAPSSLFQTLAQSTAVAADSQFSGGATDRPENFLAKFSYPANSSCLTSDSGIIPSSSAAAVVTVEASMAPLARHSSSPAGFLSSLAVDGNGELITHLKGGGGGFSLTRGSSMGCNGDGNMPAVNRILKSQLSFSGARGSTDGGGAVDWEESNSIVFSAPPSKRSKGSVLDADVIAALNHFDSEYGMPHQPIGMASVERFLQLQQDSVPCKVRAKRGCATHPRSIAERDRRTRISGKLRNLQELVPSMDKQTNTAEMLDLAVEHIKSLQTQLQELQRERANCTCGSRRAA